MPNNVDRGSSSGWLVAIIIVILIAIVVAWVGSGRWDGYHGSGNAVARNAPTQSAAGTSGGTAGAHHGTTGPNATTSASSGQKPSAQAATGGQHTAGNAGANTGTVGMSSASSSSSSKNGNANAPGSLSSIPPGAGGAGSGNTR